MVPITLLTNIELFSSASRASLETLSLVAQPRSFKRNTLVLTPEEATNTFLYVVSGWIKLTKTSAEGKEIIIDILNDKRMCGEVYIFQNNLEQAYSVYAISDVKIICFPVESLAQLIRSDPLLSTNFLQMTLKRQHHLNMAIEHLAIQNTSQRIGCFLLKACNGLEDGFITIQLPYDKITLATYLGMRPETFSRALLKLATDCRIKVDDDSLHIFDIKCLINYVCQHCSCSYPCGEN